MGLTTCPNCGCPNSTVKLKKNKHKGVIISIIVFALIVVSALGIGISKKAKELEYYSNMETVSFTMLDGAAKAENAGNLIKNVWYNAIYEKTDASTDEYTKPDGFFVSDFNDALLNLQTDTSFSGKISDIEKNQESVEKLMKELKNPPEEHKEAYDTLKEFYDCYLEFTSLATNPNGNLQSYTNDYNDLDSEVMSKYKKMEMYFE